MFIIQYTAEISAGLAQNNLPAMLIFKANTQTKVKRKVVSKLKQSIKPKKLPKYCGKI